MCAREAAATLVETVRAEQRRGRKQQEDDVILATTTVEDLDQFVKIYGAAGAEKRKLHGSKGSTVFRDPNEEDRVWAIFDWDLEGWAKFAADPEVPPIMQQAGHKSRPQVTELVGRFEA
jgi:ABC-type branched-subunit amino acid transport system substrate-binding protein